MSAHVVFLLILGGSMALGGAYGIFWGLRRARIGDTQVLQIQARLAHILSDMAVPQNDREGGE
jgi:hypothetical protein